MSTTMTTANEMTPLAATQVFERASRWEAGLVQRTEGLTWMTWGMVTAGILTTLGFLAGSDLPRPLVVAGWTPWLLFGFALTFAIWRSAALSGADAVRQPSWSAYVMKAGLVLGLVLFLHFVVRPQTIAAPMVLIGIVWACVGLFVRRITRAGRRLTIEVGATISVFSLVLEFSGLPMATTMLIGTIPLAGVPILGGLHQTMSG